MKTYLNRDNLDKERFLPIKVQVSYLSHGTTVKKSILILFSGHVYEHIWCGGLFLKLLCDYKTLILYTVIMINYGIHINI